LPDILRVTTPVINKSQQVHPNTAPDAASSFNVQNTSQVAAMQQQGRAGNQNAGVLQDKDTPTLLLSLLKDPAVAVTYLQNISLLEETFQLLPANNTTVTEEIEQIYNMLMLSPDQIAPELECQQELATTFRGEFFDFLRKLSAEQPDNAQLQMAMARQLKAASCLMNRQDVLEAVSNNLTYLKSGVLPGSELETQLESLIEALRSPDANENFPRLKNTALAVLKQLQGNLLYTPQQEKNLSIAIYNLSRYNTSRSYFREAMGWLRRALPPEQRARFSQLAEEFLRQVSGQEPMPEKQPSRVMQALTALIQKQAEAAHESASEEAKTEKILHSLLSSPCNFTPLLHFIVPAQQDGTHAFAELWINPDSDAKDMPEGAGHGVHILLVADVEGMGRFEAEFFVHDDTLDFSLFCPPGQETNYAAVMQAVPAILSGTHYRLGQTRLEPLERPRSLMDAFKSLPYKRMGVDVRI
jgi:tetratricopeptide (TPR) repeat protein